MTSRRTPQREGRRAGPAEACFASPPCFMHTLPAFAPEPDAQQRADVKRWRRAERERLLAARLALGADDRRRHAERIACALDAVVADVRGRTVGVYWPIRGEPDLRAWMARIAARGANCALPAPAARHAPLVFRAWRPGAPMRPGMWNVPVPADGREVVPEIVIAPLLGFDRAGYRLGYGTGTFDRTLAALRPRPRAIGVGYALAAIATIFPQPHDIPMDAIVTENGPQQCASGG